MRRARGAAPAALAFLRREIRGHAETIGGDLEISARAIGRGLVRHDERRTAELLRWPPVACELALHDPLAGFALRDQPGNEDDG